MRRIPSARSIEYNSAWESKPWCEHRVNGLLAFYQLKKIAQYEDGPIFATFRNTAEKVERHSFDAGSRAMTRGHLLDAVGPIGWMARRCRPDISHQMSTLQTVMKNTQVQDLLGANRMIRGCEVGSERGRCYPSGEFVSADMLQIACSDASFTDPSGDRRVLCL